MKLSVITICYNEKMIRKTCESIVKQTWQDFEWIVVDGGSTDNTLTVLEEYKDRINIFISEKDNGIYDAMNKGIKLASGEWLNFMNGGDSFYSNDVLEKVFGENKEYEATILYGWQYFSHRKFIRKYQSKIDKKFFLSEGLGHQSSFIKRELFERYGLYNDSSLKINSDHDKFIQFFLGGEFFHYLPFFIADFNDVGISSSGSHKDMIKFRLEKLSVLKQYFSDDDIQQYCIPADKALLVNPIISLTSYPARISHIEPCIHTLLNQSIVTKVILWLGEDKFLNKFDDLPLELTKLIGEHFEIRFVKDLGPYTKLIPALKAFPNNVIVTADDDILYPENWLEKLLIEYVQLPNMIHAHRCHQILFKNGKIAPYSSWKKSVINLKASYNNFLTGVAGVLYPPKSLYEDYVLRDDLFLDLSPKADDVWFWAMAVLNNTKINIVSFGYNKPIVNFDTQHDGCLWKFNCEQGMNDVYIKQVVDYFPQIINKLEKFTIVESPDKVKNKAVSTLVRYYLFGFIPIFYKFSLGKFRYFSLFGILNFWKIFIKKDGTRKHFLLSIIPLIYVKENQKRTKKFYRLFNKISVVQVEKLHNRKRISFFNRFFIDR